MKNPKSFRLVYLLTKMSYWFLIAITGIVVFAGIIMLTLDPELMDLGFASDLFHTEEVIYLNSESGIPIEVEFYAGSIDIPVKYMTRTAMASVLIMALAVLFCTILIARQFKVFMRKVLDGETFHDGTIKLLKKAAYLFVVLEVLEFIAGIVGHFYVAANFDLGNLEHVVEHRFEWPILSTNLLIALTLWVLAHIFQKGRALEEEQKLTV